MDKKIFEDLTQKSQALGKEMNQALIQLVNEAGGFIRTDEKEKDSIYGFIFCEGSLEYEERQIYAVKVENGVLYVNCDEFLEEDAWFSIYGGYISMFSTLYNLCEILPEYG